MAKNSYLQLYLDIDYILPVAVGADGNLVKYLADDRRLWLYFMKSGNRDVFETGKVIKANYEANLDGCYGGFWEKLETDEKVGTELFPYIELLEVAGLLGSLRTWCKAVLNTATPVVVLNFATTIGIKARKVFVDYMIKKGFAIQSYSTEMNDLIAEKVVYDNRSENHLAFGDQLLVIQSTGRKLLLSTMTWCGESFMQGEKPVTIDKQGEDFRRKELATMVVDKIELSNGRLNAKERETEITFQTQFADEWYKNREGNIIRVRGFFYSHYPNDIQPSITIDANKLDLRVEENSRATTDLIQKYYKKNIINRHLHTIFFGDVFCDDENGENIFRKKCVDVTESLKKFTFFNDNALQEAMGRYYYSHSDIVEPIEELEIRFLTKEQECERIRKYVKNAEILGSLRITIDKTSSELRQVIDNLKSRTQQIEDSWKAYMQHSKFSDAEKLLGGISSDDMLILALNNLHDALERTKANMSLLTELKQLNEVHVQEIVEKILQGYEILHELESEAKDLETRPNYLKERVKHYQDVYGKYLDYKKRLNRENSLGGKRRVLQEMRDQDLTMEDLPAVEVNTISAVLTCEIEEKRSGFLGLKTEKLLKVAMQVKNGGVLPFPCVLQITDSNQININRQGWCVDLNTGDSHFEKTIPLTELPKTTNGSLVMQLFPDEQNSHLTSSIDCDSKRIRI